MTIQIDTLKGIDTLSLDNLGFPYRKDTEKEQMRDQIEMLEREVDRQNVIIDALIKAIKAPSGLTSE